MGCTPSSDAKASGKEKGEGILEIEAPTTGEKVCLKYSLQKQKEEYLMNVVNSVFFGEEKNSKIDVCFLSLYSSKDDRFHYYLQRLLKVEVENLEYPYTGKMWVLYMQGKPVDWDIVVHQNLKIDVSKGLPKLQWKYEKFLLASPEQIKLKHEMSQKSNLSYLQRYTLEKNSTMASSSSEIPNQQSELPNSNEQNIKKNKTINSNYQTKTSLGLSNFSRFNTNNNNNNSNNSNNKNVDTSDDGILKTQQSESKFLVSDSQQNNIKGSSLFSQDIKGKPNVKKIALNDSSNNYNHGQRLNTEEENRTLEAPLQTEAVQGDNFDVQAAKKILGLQ